MNTNPQVENNAKLNFWKNKSADSAKENLLLGEKLAVTEAVNNHHINLINAYAKQVEEFKKEIEELKKQSKPKPKTINKKEVK